MTMTTAETLKNRLATIHKDMCDLSQAVGGAAADVKNGRATIAATIERRLTDELEERAFRLERMANAENISSIGAAVYQAALSIASAFLHQRHNCKRNRAQFIAHGATMTALTESGAFQQLIAKRKEAKAAVQAERATIAPGIPAEKAAQSEAPIVYVRRLMSLTTYRFANAADDVSFAHYFGPDFQWHEGVVTVGEWRDLLASGEAVMTNEHGCEIPEELDTTAMMESDAMKAVEGFGLNPKTVVETMTRVAGAMRRDGLTQDQITADVLAAYMEADRKTQERMFMDYMTNPEARKRVQGAVLDILKGPDAK